MVTGASTADLAVLLVDARKGVLTQTRRHSLPRAAGRHPPLRAGGEQDGPGRLRPGRVRRDLSPTIATFAAKIGIEDWMRDPGFGAQRRQCHRAAARRRLVQWAEPARASRHGRARRGRGRRQAVPHAGAVGQPAGPELPRLRRPDCVGHRSDRAPRFGSCRPGGSTRIARVVTHGRRPRRGGRRAVGDPDLRRRGRLLARRRDRRRGRSAGSRRPVRSDDRVDGRERAAAGPRLLDEDRDADRHRDGPAPEIRGERQHAGASRCADARAERHRRRRDRDRPRDRVRTLCRTTARAQPRARRLHPDRQADQRDGRLRACCTSRCGAR